LLNFHDALDDGSTVAWGCIAVRRVRVWDGMLSDGIGIVGGDEYIRTVRFHTNLYIDYDLDLHLTVM